MDGTIVDARSARASGTNGEPDLLVGDPKAGLRWTSWRFATLAFGLTLAACMFASFVLPALFRDHAWSTPGDAWWTVRSTQWVSDGAIGTVYQADPFFLPLPGLLILLAPIVALGDHLGLVTGLPIHLSYPSMWLLVGPAFFVLGSTCLLGLDYLTDTLGITTWRRRMLVLTTGLTVVVPTCVWAGHPEDLLALGLSCVSLALLLRGASLGSALVLGVAVMMQPWAGLLIPILIAANPTGRRIKALVWSCAMPGACAVMLLALDPTNAFRSLVKQPMMGVGQRLPWWGLTSHITLSLGSEFVPARVGSTTRIGAVLVAIGVAVWVARSRRPSTLIAASAIALLSRAVFETQIWCWYVAPAAVFMALGVAACTRSSRWRLAVGTVAAFTAYAFTAGSYNWWSMSPWLALLILVGSGCVAVLASMPRGDAGLASPRRVRVAGRSRIVMIAGRLTTRQVGRADEGWLLEPATDH